MGKIAIDNANDVLASCREVIAAWVFGSGKTGQVRRGSDLNVAVLFRSKPGLDQLTTLRADLQKSLRFEEIDLVVLNTASSILRFEALSGERIYCADAGRCAEFVSLAAREYEDDMAMIRRYLTRQSAADPHRVATPGSAP